MSEESRIRFSIEKLLRVPARYKLWNCGTDIAVRKYAITRQLLEQLLDLGMPHGGGAGGPCFDSLDLENVSMDLRLPSSCWLATHRWSSSLRRALEVRNPRYEFVFKATCPNPGHRGTCKLDFSPHVDSALLSEEASPGTYRLRATLQVNTNDLGNIIDPIISEAKRLVYHKVPYELAHDIGFVKETRLAQCDSSTLYLLIVAAEHGLVARPAVGLFASTPFSIRHVWLEFFVRGEWLQADPFFLHALGEWEVIDIEEWPLSCSPLAAVFRLGSTTLMNSPLVLHGNDPALCSIYTRLLGE